MLTVSLLLSLALLGSSAQGSPKEDPNYVIGPDDVITVTVLNEPGLTGRYRIENDGKFTYPFLGSVEAGGRTAAQLGAVLRTRLADGYLRDPQVTVEVDQFR